MHPWLKKLWPTWLLESVLQITPAEAKKHGIKAVLTDLDNTLIPWNSEVVPASLHNWAQALADHDIKVLILSNNNGARVRHIAEQLGVHYLAPAYKPRRKGYRQALEKLACKKEEAVLVGDQLFTDVLGASRFGLRSILVKPVVASDGKWTRVNRRLEKLFLEYCAREKLHWDWRDQLD